MSKQKLSIIQNSLILCFLGSIFFGLAQGAEPFFQKGICYVSWEKERYCSIYSDKSLGMLAQTGAEWVAIVTTYYQDKFNSKEIFPMGKTPSDESLVHAIKQAHQLGLKVMLKPHLDLIRESDGLWRGDIGFQSESDWQEWFRQYLKFILHYARLAQETKVELYCIGTELCFASTQTKFWEREIIPKVRKAYSGKLIYAANWDEYKNIRFWNSLDYIGIDAYFPLQQKGNPQYQEIKNSWTEWAQEIGIWQSKIKKPVIFTEIGYRSCDFAAAKPWENSYSARPNLEIQADCYRAAFEVVSNLSWCKGIYWWYWKATPFVGGLNNRDFTPQNKPAESILTYYYRGLSLARLSE